MEVTTSSTPRDTNASRRIGICLAISSFRNDDAVAALLELAAPLVPQVFSHVIVVDSLGTERIPTLISNRGWDFVRYHSAEVNLGSAGNLEKRLRMAAESAATFVYALNHDGQLEERTVLALVDAAVSIDSLGAAYPLRALPNRANQYDVTGTSRLLRPRKTRAQPIASAYVDAYWSSSNGALYALAPVRAGLAPWGDLWMGWEDLGYGWLLHAHGYRQIIVRDAVFQDPYEFRAIGTQTSKFHITDKASWYAYYGPRNLVLIAKRLNPPWLVQASVASRIALEIATTVLFRSDKRERLQLIVRGVRDGLSGRAGK